MEIIMAIITSFIASVVFYFCFQFIPEKKKYNKIRPRIEIELMEVTNILFFYLEMPFRNDMHSPSLFQKEMHEGILEQKDFEMGLYNKCLSEAYLYDENAGKLMPIGDQLSKTAQKASSKIKQLLINQQYLSAEEILIIEDIERLLYTYLYHNNPIDRIENITVRPINPTIYYMSENFYKLYQLWKELRSLLHECKYIGKEKRQGKERYFILQLEKAKNFIKDKEYAHAVKCIKKISKTGLTESQKTFVDFIHLQIDVETNNIENAGERLSQLLRSAKREKIVYLRDFLTCIRDNEALMGICRSLCSADEMNHWNKTVDNEKRKKEKFIEQNNQLKQYYDEKIRKQHPIKHS